MWQKIRNEEGFTLLEIIITLGILGIIMIPLSNLFIGSVKYSANGKEKMLAGQVAQQYMEHAKAMPLGALLDLSKEDAKEDPHMSNMKVKVSAEAYGGYEASTDGIQYALLMGIKDLEKKTVSLYRGDGTSLHTEAEFDDSEESIKIVVKDAATEGSDIVFEGVVSSYTYTYNNDSNLINIKVYDASEKDDLKAKINFDIENQTSKTVNLYVQQEEESQDEIYFVKTGEVNVYTQYSLSLQLPTGSSTEELTIDNTEILLGTQAYSYIRDANNNINIKAQSKDAKTLQVKNETNHPVKIYLIPSGEYTGKITVDNQYGEVYTYHNISDSSALTENEKLEENELKGNIEKVYQITVKVTKKDNTPLFTLKGLKKIE